MTNFLISIQTKSQKGGAFCQKHEVRLKALDKKRRRIKNQRKIDKSTIGKLTSNQLLYLNKQATIQA